MTDLVDHTLEHETQHCIECGAPLTQREQQRVLEDGIPPLCTVHAVEAEPALEDEDDTEPA